jgi:PAS domain S-box-containing protein
MNWSSQVSLAFHLLNNAALLAVGTVGYCELRHRVRDRLPSWVQALLYGALFGVMGLLVSFAPGVTAIGYPITLRGVVIVIATLYCGVAAGATATLMHVVYITFLQGQESAAGLPFLIIVIFALSAAYRTLLRPRDRTLCLGELCLVAVVITVAVLGAVAWLRGPQTFAAGFALTGPAFTSMLVLSTISLGAVIRHIDRSHALAAALSNSERRFRSLYNETPVMLTAVGLNDRFNAVSDRWLHFMGYSREEVIGKSRYDFHAPTSATHLRDTIMPALAQRRQLPEWEGQLVRKDGTTLDVSVTSVLHKDPATGAQEVLSFTVDQTARKQAERALEQRESDLRAIADNAPFEIFLKDREGRYRLVNRRLEEGTGLKAADIIGRTDAEVRSFDLAKQIRADDLEVLEDGKIHQIERQPTRKRGPDECILVTKFPIRDSNQEITGIAGFAVDITERKRAEAALAESRELLIQSQRLGKVGHLVSDRKTQRVYWSDTLFELRGIPKREYFTLEETLSTPRIHPEDHGRFESTRDAGIAERRDFQVDIRVQRPSGDYAWEAVTGRPRYDQDGNLASVLYVLQDITDRKRAEEALRRQEADLRAIMDNAPFAIFLKDGEGRYRLINRTYTDWSGDRLEDLYGKKSAEVYSGKRSEVSESTDREVLESGEIAVAEWKTERAKPGLEYVRMTKFPIRDAEGRIVGLAGFIADITTQKKVEERLEAREADLRAIMDNAPLAIFLKDREMRYRLINRTYTGWFGDRPEDLIGRKATEVYPEDLARSWEAIDRELMRTGEISHEERRLQKAKPGLEYTLTTKFPIRDQDGAMIGFAGIIADITDRKHAEEALRLSEARFRALIEHSNDMVDVVTGDGQVTYRSPANAEVLGYGDEEVVGRSISERVHPGDAADILSALKSLTDGTKRRATGRSRLLHKNGAWRTVAWSARDARNVPGIDGIIVNSRDVTEAQQLEEQLQESQKMDAVGQLAGGVAHDFNNILGAILGFGGFLLQDLPPDIAEHGFAERIVKAAERGKELVQQILAFARRSPVERKPFDLNGLVREARELLRASVPSSTRLEVQVCKTALVAEVNAGQVTQILVNLCLNANDALEGEPGNIVVNLSRVEPSDSRGASLELQRDGLNIGRVVVGALKPGTAYARIAVADSGIGMNTDVLTHIFDPFFTTKRRGRGTGLGLSVVHGIAMAYEGALVVTSKPGDGSVFEVYLPLCDARPETSSPAVQASGQRGSERVLVVDDELMMTDVLTTGLDRLGYESVGVNDALEVTRLFAEDPTLWDVVISDQVMPKMKGIALCRALKQIRPSLCFILCTGFSEGLTEEEALSAGADAFFLKPVRLEDIATAIRKILARGASAAE